MNRKLFLKTFEYKSVKEFQAANGLTADGVWGPATEAKAKTKVVQLQAWLIFAGYDLACDGLIGKDTVKKLAAFQTARHIKGIGTTLRALKPELKKGYVSPHFKKSEFRCECGGKWCDGYNSKKVSLQLLGVLEMIRRKTGKPVHITSGIRCQRYNDSLVGSIPNSVHRLGGAADIYISGTSPATIRKLAYKYGAAYSYFGTSNMGSACHINI